MLTIVVPANENQIFAPTAFDSNIGQHLEVHGPWPLGSVEGEIVRVKVADDGRSAELEIRFEEI
jgi:hypothetical protein